MMYRHSGELNTTIPAGHKLNLKLTNDELVSLLCTKESFPKSQIGTGIITDYFVDYKCSKEQMELFGKEGVSVVDAHVLDKRFSKVLKEKRGIKLKQRAACMITD